MTEWVGSALLVACCGLVNAAPLTIVENGAPRAAIVVAAGEPHARQAAEAIQQYIEKMSGAKLPIVNEGEAVSAPCSIFVGHTAAAAKSGITIPAGHDPSIRPDAFEEEGYVLKTKGNNLFIGGNADGPYRGTLYGAYAFLEKLGCRWYFPGDWGEIVPARQTLSVPELNVESRPDFPVRNISAIGGWQVPSTEKEAGIYRDWCVKVGFAPSYDLGMYPLVGDGFLGLLLPAREYWDKHPDYYARDQNGNRTIGDSEHTTMLCLSNPEVLTESVKNIKAAFAGQRPGQRISPTGFGISPPDGSPYCYCDKCRAASQNFDYPSYFEKLQMSEEFFGFAAKLAREFPDKYVATMAYYLREIPPQGVTLLPNMSVYYAPLSNCALHSNADPSCWRRQEFVKMLRQYRRQTPHVYLYEYQPGAHSTGLFVPERQTANAAANIPLYKEIDIKGIGAEGRKAFMETWTSYYVIAKLLWDSQTDVAALKKEFYDNFFGPQAGPQVQAWWDACEQALGDATIHGQDEEFLSGVYTVGFTKSIHRFVAAALKSRTTAAQRQRVEAFALIADHLEAISEMWEAEQNLQYAAAAAAAGRAMEDEKQLQDIYSFFISPRVEQPPRSNFIEGYRERYRELAAMTGGEKGTMVAPLPLAMRFTRDRFNQGVIGEYYAPEFNDKQWGTKNTFFTWDAQDQPEDSQGHDYDGYGWYRGTFTVPAGFKDKPVHFCCGGHRDEIWIWVNGRYAGHPRGHGSAHYFPGQLSDLDITNLVQPGQTNTIAIRLWNKAGLGGLFRRGFFWSPK